MPIRYNDIVPAIGIDKFKNSRYRIVNIGISAISSTALPHPDFKWWRTEAHESVEGTVRTDEVGVAAPEPSLYARCIIAIMALVAFELNGFIGRGEMAHAAQEIITLQLEYAYEINSLSQTCQRLYNIANNHLFRCYAKECSPRGLERVVKNNNARALYKLLTNGLSFDQYFRTTGYATTIMLTVETDLSKIAELLVAYSEVCLKSDRCKYGLSVCGPGHREYEDDLEGALYRAAIKGSLGVTKVLVSSTGVKKWQKPLALAYAVSRGQLALARYLIEEGGVDVNHKISRTGFFESFLSQAAYQGNLQMVELLVMAGANVNNPGLSRITECPLYVAAARNHEAVVQYLIEKGMRFHSVGFYGTLHLAEYFNLPDYTVSNVVKSVDLGTIIAGPEYQRCGGYARSRVYDVVAACNDLPVYRQAWNMRDSSHDWRHLAGNFGTAVLHGNLTVARYIVDEMMLAVSLGVIASNLPGMVWAREWRELVRYTTFYYDSAPAFDILLDCGPLGDLTEARKDWLNDLFSEARSYPGHMEILLQRGYLDEMVVIRVVKEILVGALGAGNLAFVWRLLNHCELGPLDALDDSDPEYHEQSVLHIAARHSPLKTFREFLSTQNLTLNPNLPIYCSALVSAAVGCNVAVIGYFLRQGFGINSLYEAFTSKKEKVTEALIIHVTTAGIGPDDCIEKTVRENIAATVNFLLDHGAQVDTKDSLGRTALSIALEAGNPELADMLFHRGADPLIGLESRDKFSALEQLVRIFLREEYDMSHFTILQASLEVMSARGYRCDYFLRLMPRIEDTISRPKVVSQFEDAPGVKGPLQLAYYEDRIYVRWSHFFSIREMRKRYWRALYPIPSE
ncbi:ankyrin repeat domain-containing protein [Aspergillus affinis]|uniref:ankyrin repeat domain-containing protein n=1 Tax=Aspergillus affinis TaxID=1070780 RepID=UPI0022FE3CAF|nr:uncharacterized protein KD926_003145 [Aspergillus affinis]KAI9035667.1 hypothetical protein KD926_003145 [Aspergillus affinis]